MRDFSINWITLAAAALLVLPSPPATAAGSSAYPISASRRVGRSTVNPRAAEDALREISRAQGAIARVLAVRQHELENSAEWLNAVEAARNARSDYNRARSNSMAVLEGDPDFRSTRIELWKLQEALGDVQQQARPRTGQLKDRRVEDLSAQLLAKRSELTRMQSELMGGDDSLRQAKDAMVDAEARVVALKKGFTESVKSDPQWQQARRQYEQASTRLARMGQ
jgi:hypothetical protein